MAMFNPEYFCLNEKVVSKLQDYQIERINKIVADFIATNLACDQHEIEYCPKCGAIHPRTIRSGKSPKGKQMLECKACGRRFVYDTGSLTFYSHQSLAKWVHFIELTIEMASMDKCAEELGVHKSTAFRMRHKLMAFIRMTQKDDSLAGLCEIDETYLHVDRKGLVPELVGESFYKIFCLCSLGCEIRRRYGTLAGSLCKKKIDELNESIKISVKQGYREKKENTKRGISKQKVCVITGIERQGSCFYKATNLGKPSAENIRDFAEHLEENSHVWTDGLQGYIPVLEDHHCTYTVCPSNESYTVLDHLNNVNALHSDFKEWIRTYRGVNTIYADRYAGLFSYIYDHRNMETSELRTTMIQELNRHQMYFYVKDIMRKDIFVAEEDQYAREMMTSMAAQYRRFKKEPMEIKEALQLIGYGM